MKALILIGAILLLFAVLLRKKVADLGSGLLDRFTQAIAYAEGFYQAGSRAARNHNPGNMTKDLIGKAVGKDGIFVVYSNDQDGWANLKEQIRLAYLGGNFSAFSPSDTLLEFAKRYTATDQLSWANNVAAKLGVNINTKLSELV